MPSVTTVIEDTSPLLVYSANWQPGSSSSDPLADLYSQSSFTLTQTRGASMSFAFYGTSVTVYGARRSNHGNYMAQIDNNPPSPSNGQSSSNQFNQVLFNSNTSLAHHTLTITNDDNTFFDVDYVAFESSVGQDGEDLIVNMFENTHPAFRYTPLSSWTTPNNVGTFLGGSGQFFCDSGVRISRDAVALYGPVGPNSSLTYTVQVDNGDPSVFSANKGFYRSQQMLYFAANLGSGPHSIKVHSAGATSSEEFAIDYATVYTTRSLGGSFLAMAPANTVSRIPPGAIAGLVLTTTLAILASLLSVFLIWRQRHNTSILGRRYKHKPNVGVQGPEFAQPFTMYPSIQRARSTRSTRSTTNSQRSSEISSQPLTSFTVPMTTTMTMSNAPSTQSAVETNSNFYATSALHPDVPVSVSHASGSVAHVQETRPTRSEKNRINPTGSSVQQNYDQPTTSGPHYVGIQLPAQYPLSPTTAPPPEYTQKPPIDDHTLHITNQ